MTKLRTFVIAVLVLVLAACASWRQAVDASLSIAQMACITYEMNAGTPDENILAACQLEERFAPVVRQLIEARKSGIAYRRMSAYRGEQPADVTVYVRPVLDGGLDAEAGR